MLTTGSIALNDQNINIGVAAPGHAQPGSARFTPFGTAILAPQDADIMAITLIFPALNIVKMSTPHFGKKNSPIFELALYSNLLRKSDP